MNIQPLKNCFPFRLGTTSYILPKGYAENVAFLGPLVDDVELLFFESEGVHSLPEAAELGRLVELKAEHDLSYTLHLPLDLHPGTENGAVRRSSMEPCRRIVAATSALEPLAWILHVPAPVPGQKAEWHFESMEHSIGELEKEGLERKNLCLETLDYPFEQVLEIAKKHDVSLCIDVGHLLLHSLSVDDCLNSCLERCQVVHLHGIREKKDHQELSLLDPDIMQKVISTLAGTGRSERVLTLEVFGQEAFLSSMATMRKYLL
jgi:sugar phosphate isomerase/epimerase